MPARVYGNAIKQASYAIKALNGSAEAFDHGPIPKIPISTKERIGIAQPQEVTLKHL